MKCVEEKLVDPSLASDYEALARLGAGHSSLQAEMERLYEEWGNL